VSARGSSRSSRSMSDCGCNARRLRHSTTMDPTALFADRLTRVIPGRRHETQPPLTATPSARRTDGSTYVCAPLLSNAFTGSGVSRLPYRTSVSRSIYSRIELLSQPVVARNAAASLAGLCRMREHNKHVRVR
jgi:hypothetical protein